MKKEQKPYIKPTFYNEVGFFFVRRLALIYYRLALIFYLRPSASNQRQSV